MLTSLRVCLLACLFMRVVARGSETLACLLTDQVE